MSADYPTRATWLAIRHTPANLHRTRIARLVYSGGTYVRPRGTAEDKRLKWYQAQCNGNAQGMLASRARRRVAI